MSSKKPIVAIIEDDQGFREALAGMLASYGYEPIEFSRADEFLASVNREHISCIISDIQMPGMSGFELHERIATSARPIPILLITALPSEEGRKRAAKAGVACYLPKPFADEDLLACIQKALRGSSI